MKLLVTGGAGFLGSEVCRLALGRGAEVLATQFRTPPPRGRAVALDIRDPDAVERVVLRHGPDVVVHTAYVQQGEELHDTVVRGSRAIAAAAHRVGARLIHLSTDLVFDGDAGAPYSEDDEPRPVLDYGAAKLAAEALVLRAHPEATLVRTSLLYGKPDGPQERLAARDDVTFFSDEIRCPTRVDELAEALLELATVAAPGPLHVAGPQAVSRLELARRLGAVDPRAAKAPPGRPRNVALDCARARALLATRLHGIDEPRE